METTLFQIKDFPVEIQKILDKCHRVELIPVKDGVKAIHIKREEIKSKQ